MKNGILSWEYLQKAKVPFLYCFVFLSYLLAFSSCGESRQHVSNMEQFQNRDTLSPIVKYIDGATKLVDLLVMDDFIVVQSDVEAHNNQLAVYDKRTFEFLYGFVVKGHGNNEVMALDMLQSPEGDTLEIIDQTRYKITKYQISRNKATLVSELLLKLPAIGPLQEIYRQNDSILVFNTLDRILQTYNTNSHEIVSTCNVRDSLEIEMEQKDLASFHFVLHGNKLCLGFRHINSLVLGEIDDSGRISAQVKTSVAA